MNKFKFRVWDEDEKRFWFFDLQELLERRMSYRGSFDEKIMIGIKEQSTGLHDKNGVEIYEGDIISNGYYIETIEELGSHIIGCFTYRPKGAINKNSSYCICDLDCSVIEIIGNIHVKKEV